jgi:transcriptional regulator with XRE-family HTH domain
MLLFWLYIRVIAILLAMAKRTSELLPASDALLRSFGDRLRLARLRRALTAKQVASRAGMALMTLRSLERGSPGVTIGSYVAVMQVLGLETDLERLAASDALGHELSDSRLPHRSRAEPEHVVRVQATRSASKLAPHHAGDGFVTAAALASVLKRSR